LFQFVQTASLMSSTEVCIGNNGRDDDR